MAVSAKRGEVAGVGRELTWGCGREFRALWSPFGELNIAVR